MTTEVAVQAEKKGTALQKAPEENYVDKVRYIIKMQALWRGYRDRKYTSFLKNNHRGASKYFTPDESRETVSRNRKYDPNAQREERSLYTFKTGATYTG